jgi:hypothetical protein
VVSDTFKQGTAPTGTSPTARRFGLNRRGLIAAWVIPGTVQEHVMHDSPQVMPGVHGMIKEAGRIDRMKVEGGGTESSPTAAASKG